MQTDMRISRTAIVIRWNNYNILEGKNMAETMRGLKRSHRCAELSKANIGETVTVMG